MKGEEEMLNRLVLILLVIAAATSGIVAWQSQDQSRVRPPHQFVSESVPVVVAGLVRKVEKLEKDHQELSSQLELTVQELRTQVSAQAQRLRQLEEENQFLRKQLLVQSQQMERSGRRVQQLESASNEFRVRLGEAVRHLGQVIRQEENDVSKKTVRR